MMKNPIIMIKKIKIGKKEFIIKIKGGVDKIALCCGHTRRRHNN